LKDIFRREILQCLPAHTLHNLGEQKVVGIGVVPFVAGGKVEPFLPHDDSERVIICRHVVIMDARKKEQRHLIPQSARVVEQLENSDLLSIARIIRQLWDVLANIIIQPQFSLFF